jgi:hypothetical protein
MYAKKTKVPVGQSRNEVETLLVKNGATGFMYGHVDGKTMIAFELRERRLRFIVPMPQVNKTRSNEREVGAEIRRRWRALLLVLKAKLEAVDSQIVQFDEEFLAHIVVRGSETVGDIFVPQMREAIATGKLPPLLGPGGGE